MTTVKVTGRQPQPLVPPKFSHLQVQVRLGASTRTTVIFTKQVSKPSCLQNMLRGQTWTWGEGAGRKWMPGMKTFFPSSSDEKVTVTHVDGTTGKHNSGNLLCDTTPHVHNPAEVCKKKKKKPNLGFFDEDTKAEKPHARPHN